MNIVYRAFVNLLINDVLTVDVNFIMQCFVICVILARGTTDGN